MIKGAPATAEATATPGASATTEMQNYPASDSDPSGASDVGNGTATRRSNYTDISAKKEHNFFHQVVH